MNLFALPPLASSALFLLLGVFIFLSNRKSIVNGVFFLVCFVTAWWQFNWFILFNIQDQMVASFLVKLGYAGIILIPVTFFHFFTVFLKKRGFIDRFLVYFSYILALIFEISLFSTDYFVSGFHSFFWGYYPKAGWLHPIYLLLLFILFFRILYLLIAALKQKNSLKGNEYYQVKYLLWGMIFYGFASTDFIVNYGFEFYPPGFIFIVIFLIFVAYAIIKSQFLNAKAIATEVFAVFLSLVSLVEIFYFKSTLELVARIVIFAATLIFAVLLIRSVLAEIKRKEAEIKRREEVESLNKQLKKVSKELEKKNIHLGKLLEMRSEFLDIASHQLKTPVSVILGTSSMFREGTMDKLSKEEQAHFIDNIFQKAKKLNSIISDILRASEMDTEEFKLDEKIIHPTPLAEVAESVYEDLKDLAKEKGLEFSLVKPEKPLPRIMADPDFLSHAIFNLADNAIKYTAKGSVIMALSEDKGRVILKVSDTGIGIPSADQKRMFDKFARAKNAVNMYTDGSGLGLFIVKKITEAHPGGKIGFESQENKGTAFTISFPGLKK